MSGAGAELALVCPACRGGLEVVPPGRRCCACRAAYVEAEGILRLTVGREGAPSYDPRFFEPLPELEDRHFWFLARREVILDALRSVVPDWHTRPLFDVGCGTGGLLAWLAEQGLPLAGACDAHLEALHATRARVRVPLVQVDEGRLPPLAPGTALLSLFDVLEHLDDDLQALAWARSVLAPGGFLVLTVPAHPFLFDEMDRLACHRRRYRRRELSRKLEQAGFEVRRLTHFMAPLVPMLALTRALRWNGAARDAELRVVPYLNGALRALLRLERGWLRAASLPFGTSLLAVARRPAA